MKTTEQIRAAFMRVHDYAVRDSRSSYMSIPADPSGDADLIVCAAIDELGALRARVRELEAAAQQALSVVGYALHGGPSAATRSELEDVERNLGAVLAK